MVVEITRDWGWYLGHVETNGEGLLDCVLLIWLIPTILIWPSFPIANRLILQINLFFFIENAPKISRFICLASLSFLSFGKKELLQFMFEFIIIPSFQDRKFDFTRAEKPGVDFLRLFLNYHLAIVLLVEEKVLPAYIFFHHLFYVLIGQEEGIYFELDMVVDIKDETLGEPLLVLWKLIVEHVMHHIRTKKYQKFITLISHLHRWLHMKPLILLRQQLPAVSQKRLFLRSEALA